MSPNSAACNYEHSALLPQGYKFCARVPLLMETKRFLASLLPSEGAKSQTSPRCRFWEAFPPGQELMFTHHLDSARVRGSPGHAPLARQAGRDMRFQAQAPACFKARECCSAWKWPFFDFLALPCRCHAGCQLLPAGLLGQPGTAAPGLALAAPRAFVSMARGGAVICALGH